MEGYIWAKPNLPKYSKKKGPIDFIFNLWNHKGRHAISTIAIDPSDVLKK